MVKAGMYRIATLAARVQRRGSHQLDTCEQPTANRFIRRKSVQIKPPGQSLEDLESREHWTSPWLFACVERISSPATSNTTFPRMSRLTFEFSLQSLQELPAVSDSRCPSCSRPARSSTTSRFTMSSTHPVLPPISRTFRPLPPLMATFPTTVRVSRRPSRAQTLLSSQLEFPVSVQPGGHAMGDRQDKRREAELKKCQHTNVEVLF